MTQAKNRKNSNMASRNDPLSLNIGLLSVRWGQISWSKADLSRWVARGHRSRLGQFDRVSLSQSSPAPDDSRRVTSDTARWYLDVEILGSGCCSSGGYGGSSLRPGW